SLEISFSNACNMACRMCNAYLSSSWYDDAKALMGYQGPRRHFLDWDFTGWDLSRLGWLKILGGEPLYERKNLEFMQFLKEKNWLGNICLHLTTNTSVTLSAEWEEVIRCCKSAKIFCSIDGLGPVNEYLRHGADWQATEKVFAQFLELQNKCPSVELSVHTVVSVFNCLYLGQLEGWLNQVAPNQVNWNLDFLFEPRQMSLVGLPSLVKQDICQRLPEFSRREEVLRFLKVHEGSENPNYFLEFEEFNSRLDARRGQNWRDVFQEVPGSLLETPK
ncbi:MAG: twitch domain-containing radical SAM protein, partial [Bdellovibrionales bacterium]|nr:twitch domain-containing radical SAM protein [Bdellovibrionales bacterium]